MVKFEDPISLYDLVGYSYNIEGNKNTLIHGIGVVYNIIKGDLCFAENEKLLIELLDSKCNAIITNKNLSMKIKNKKGKAIIVTDNPSKLFAKILHKQDELPNFTFNVKSYNINESKISIDAFIDDDVKFGNNCIVYPQVYIDRNVVIGNYVTIHPGVKIYPKTKIGNNVIIKSNAVIGNNPNWLFKDNDLYYDFQGQGGVRIGNNVSIGSNTVIDRDLVRETTIMANSKIGNNVEIGHGSKIEENVLIISQTGIAGGTHIGKNTKIHGQCGVNSNLYIAPNTIINAKTAITTNIIEENKSYFGIPGEEKKFYSKKKSALNRLPRLISKNEVFKVHGDLPNRIATVISEQLNVDQEKLNMNFDFIQDGGADSLDLVELTLAIEEEFDVTILEEEEKQLKTVSSLYKFLRRKGIRKGTNS